MVNEKAKSKAQQRFMGMVRAAQKGERPASAKIAKVAKSMKKKDVEDYVSTKHKNLPKKKKKMKHLIRNMVRESLAETTWASPSIRKAAEDDIKKMSNILGKASYSIIKIMLAGVKTGKYDPIDLAKSIQQGPVKLTHKGERDFLKVLWDNIRTEFKRYKK